MPATRIRTFALLAGLSALLAPAAVALPSVAAPDGPGLRGTPGHWTKVSTGVVGIDYEPSLVRTPDGLLHVVYAKDASGGGEGQIGHTSLTTGGTIVTQNDILLSTWSDRTPTPIVIPDAGGENGLRVVFGGDQTLGDDFWSHGQMYTATSTDSGESWTLPANTVGQSHSAYASYGTAATTLADGTPVAGFPYNSDFTWHVGTGGDPDHVFTFGSCCLYDGAMVRDGDDVWAAWYANGSTAATNGTFVMQIAPTVGTPIKAPGSSDGADSSDTGRVALAARDGGGVYAAYCVGYPTCDKIRLWKVGTSQTKDVPKSKYADDLALSPGPSGRLWLAWRDNIPTVHAVRTSVAGLGLGPIRKVGMPPGKSAVESLAINGTMGRGDIVINVGDGLWHSQVFAGLTVKAAPKKWRHGSRKVVRFTVTDATDAVAGAKVKVGSSSCRTGGAGTCTLTFGSSYATGKHKVLVTKSGYARASAVLKVT